MAAGPVDISDWAQGDACLDVDAIPVACGQEIVDISSDGAVLISQTCDIVRDYNDRPYVQIARLIAANADEVESARRFHRPRYAFVPGLAGKGLIADLDIVATVDKADVAKWTRTPGCGTDRERRAFGYALARHKGRFAFPDKCSKALAKLRNWVKAKGNKESDEGKFVRAVEQMRISSDSELELPGELLLYCVIAASVPIETRGKWSSEILPRLEKMIDASWCPKVTARLVTTAELTVDEYLASLRLDFDALTES